MKKNFLLTFLFVMLLAYVALAEEPSQLHSISSSILTQLPSIHIPADRSIVSTASTDRSLLILLDDGSITSNSDDQLIPWPSLTSSVVVTQICATDQRFAVLYHMPNYERGFIMAWVPGGNSMQQKWTKEDQDALSVERDNDQADAFIIHFRDGTSESF